MEYRYHIGNFYWNKELNTFFSEAWNLSCFNTDGSIHPESFPNGKKEFFIDNPNTGGFRRFRFVKEESSFFHQVDETGNGFDYECTDWVFESEDGIKCSILVSES